MESRNESANNSDGTKDNPIKKIIADKILPILKEKSAAVKSIIKDKAGSAALNTVNDEKIMKSIFEKIYGLVPAPVCFFIKQESFVQYCFDNKAKIIQMLEKV